MVDFITQFFDPYERKARLMPAMIAVTPAVVALYCLFPQIRNMLSAALGTVFFLGVSFFLGKLARNKGKEKEEKLFKIWGGKPTTRFLRHRDSTIDQYTKARYHTYLKKNVANISIPTMEEEINDPEQADLVYESAVRWLLQQTRDTQKYNLLFKDNVSYGFARNYWAIKPWTICINLFVLIGTIIIANKRYNFDLNIIPAEVWLSLVINFLILVFTLFFTEKSVHLKAKAYARTLLEVCDK